jgi:hypothetical protein
VADDQNHRQLRSLPGTDRIRPSRGPARNQLFFSSIAYVLMNALRRLGLSGTELEQAQCQTIRLKLLKIGALVRVSVRKVWVKMASGCPYAELFRQVHAKLAALPPFILRR